MADPFAGLPFSVPVQYQGIIEMASQSSGIPATVLASQIQAESGFNPNATSSAGAEGIAQFEPATAADNGVNPWDPNSAIPGMAHLDSQYLAQFGSLDLALAAYNAGPGAVTNAGNQIPAIPETQKYVSSILQNAGLPGPTGTVPNPADNTTGASTSSILSLLGSVDSPDFWKRIGKGAIGAGLLAGGLFFLVSKQPGTMKPVRELVNIP
jgi:hypothetical protein